MQVNVETSRRPGASIQHVLGFPAAFERELTSLFENAQPNELRAEWQLIKSTFQQAIFQQRPKFDLVYNVTQGLQATALCSTYSLEDVRTVIDMVHTSGLPIIDEREAAEHIILKSFAQWHVPLDELISKLKSSLVKALEDILSSILGPSWTKEFCPEAFRTIHSCIEKQIKQLKTAAHRTLRIERTKPVTLARQLLDEKISENVVFLQCNGRSSRPSLTQELSKPEHDAHPTASSRSQKIRAKSSATIALGTNQNKSELGVIARVWAYYDIASARFVDQVVQAVEAELFPELSKNFGPELEDVLTKPSGESTSEQTLQM